MMVGVWGGAPREETLTGSLADPNNSDRVMHDTERSYSVPEEHNYINEDFQSKFQNHMRASATSRVSRL